VGQATNLEWCTAFQYTYILIGIGDNATMRTPSTIFIIHPFFNDRLQLSSKVSDMQRFFSYNRWLAMNRVGAVPPEAIYESD
jgi:hypothetical protein